MRVWHAQTAEMCYPTTLFGLRGWSWINPLILGKGGLVEVSEPAEPQTKDERDRPFHLCPFPKTGALRAVVVREENGTLLSMKSEGHESGITHGQLLPFYCEDALCLHATRS